MKEKINEILLWSNQPAQEIYDLTKKKIHRNMLHFGVYVFILSIAFVYLLHRNKPTKEQIFTACVPLVDSMQRLYQTRLDFLVDSLETDYYSKLKKH